MPEPTKKDWDTLREGVGELKAAVGLHQQSLVNLDEFRKDAEPNMWFIHWLRWILGLVLVGFLVGGCSLVERFIKQESRTQAHEELIQELRGQVRKLDDHRQALKTAHDNLRRHVTVLYDRQPKGPVNLPEAIVFWGQVLHLGPDEITILSPDPGEPAQRFLLPPKVPVRIDGKDARFSDLKLGMKVGVLCMGGSAKSIEGETSSR